MKLDFTNEMVFSFNGPNLCLLGNTEEFKLLALAILDLTIPKAQNSINLTMLDFIERVGDEIEVIFCSKPHSNKLGILNGNGLLFELDDRYWERIFKYFVMMSWNMRTYYLNEYEDCLSDLELKQECNFICSSEF